MSTLPSLIRMMSDLIAAPSISSASESWDQSNKAVIELLETWLTSLGFQCKVLPLPKQPHKFNLIATIGTGNGGLVLSGHTDTVPFDEELWSSDPFKLEERDQKLFGLGTCDMKGFFAIAIDAIKDLDLNNLREPLILLATADEETSMEGAKALSQQANWSARYALIGEPTSLTPIYAHKGNMGEKIKVTGQSGHSSNPALGNNAMDAMHEVMTELMTFRNELKTKHRDSNFAIEYPTLNLGCIHGGDSPNRICGQCELEFDIRVLPGMSNDALFNEISRRLPSIAERTGTDIELSPLYEDAPSFLTPKDSDIVKACETLTKSTAETAPYSTEAPFLNELGMETLVLGPGTVHQAHKPDEYMALDQIAPMQSIIRSLVKRYCY